MRHPQQFGDLMKSARFIQIVVWGRHSGEVLFVQLSCILEMCNRGIDPWYGLCRCLRVRWYSELNLEEATGLTQVIDRVKISGMSSRCIGVNARRSGRQQ